MDRDQVNAELARLVPWNAIEAGHRATMLEFLARHEAFASRSTLDGHFTASGWVLSPDGEKAYLLLHAKLNRWLQPGGHVEDQDRTLAEAALREVVEELGIDASHLTCQGLFDVDVHTIPARANEPQHLHLDCRFLFTTSVQAQVQISAESHGFKAVPLVELVGSDTEESLRRMAQKTMHRASKSVSAAAE
jgi:8-oxo-dGTP pyrophosphatase MutT (NUDIX family)